MLRCATSRSLPGFLKTNETHAMTDPLLEPLVFRNGRVAPNRLWLAPMTNKSSHSDGHLSEDELRFLTARAEGSFGVVET